MADEWSFIPNVITAISGLGGVGLGAWLTTLREEAREKRLESKDVIDPAFSNLNQAA